MSRLIDADALKEYFVDLATEKDTGFGDTSRMITVNIDHVIETIDDAPTIEPCEDAISREEAIKAIARLHIVNDEESIRKLYMKKPHSTQTDFEEVLVYAFDAIEALPSVAPSRPNDQYDFDAPNAYRELVRCGECKYCNLDVCVGRRLDGYERYINICKRHTREWVVNKDWFCADGERRENAD